MLLLMLGILGCYGPAASYPTGSYYDPTAAAIDRNTEAINRASQRQYWNNQAAISNENANASMQQADELRQELILRNPPPPMPTFHTNY